MNQEQFNMIVKILQSGAPALAAELIQCLSQLIDAYQKQNKELDALKTKAEENKTENVVENKKK